MSSDHSPRLFQPIQLRDLTLNNRIVVSPMCQYSSLDGCAQDWHLMHLGNLSLGGAGLLITEMTNVAPEGRISPNCMGLYNDQTESSLSRVIDFCKQHSDTPIATQLAHAGRKASTRPPWESRTPVGVDEGGWQPLGPSAVGSSERSLVPKALSVSEIEDLIEAFGRSAERARRAGFDAIEVHAAHGYLLHQFLSPLSNLREDDYGGSLENRMRFPLAVFNAIRDAFPESAPVGVRISATDWVEGGWDLEQSAVFAQALEADGCDWLDVSSGGLSPAQVIPTGPGYQVPFAEALKKQLSMPVMSVGMITEAQQAESIIANEQADCVVLGRAMLYNPRWAWHTATELGVDLTYPNQYLRCRPEVLDDVFADRGSGKR